MKIEATLNDISVGDLISFLVNLSGLKINSSTGSYFFIGDSCIKGSMYKIIAALEKIERSSNIRMFKISSSADTSYKSKLCPMEEVERFRYKNKDSAKLLKHIESCQLLDREWACDQILEKVGAVDFEECFLKLCKKFGI